jgi:hypothetical protein
VNRPLTGAPALILMMSVALPAPAQTPLVVGAVRDQHGGVVAGATVVGRRLDQPSIQTVTDASGTFSLSATGVASVLVTCRYCGPALVPVTPGEPVVVIVRRYAALAEESPSSADLENLPYAHVESTLALHPFTLLDQSTAPYPGPRLSDRGLSPSGSLLLDEGTANYDIVSGSSPYELIPAQFQRDASLGSASNAFSYGNQAGGGTVTVDPYDTNANWQVATLGSDAIGRAQVGSQSAQIVAASYSNNEESRQRADFAADFSPGMDQSLAFTAGTEQGRSFESDGSQYAGSFSFANATFTDARLANLYASASLDRGDYALGSGEYFSSAVWSDSAFNVGFHSTGPVSTFADLGVRASTGLYDQQQLLPLPSIGATLTQTRADAGINATGRDYDVTAGIGAFWIDYAGGANGISQASKATLAVPSLQAQLFPNDRWSLNLEGSGSFTLPTFVEQYSDVYSEPTSVEFTRNELLAAILTYTDQSRLRASFEAASQRVAGASSGTITSAGVSAIWQVAPAIALRAWTMHVTDSVPSYGGEPAYGGLSAPTVSALWLTYDTGDAIRLDAIYRQDLLNGAPFYHVDGAISGPIVNRLRWYAGVEDRLRRTFVDVGLRFGGQ